MSLRRATRRGRAGADRGRAASPPTSRPRRRCARTCCGASTSDSRRSRGSPPARSASTRTRRNPPSPPPGGVGTPAARPTLDVQAARVDPDGHVVRTLQGPFSSRDRRVHASAASRARPGPSGRDGAVQRVELLGTMARAAPSRCRATSDVAVVISPLSDVEATMRACTGSKASRPSCCWRSPACRRSWLVRVGLRPLVHIADTADAVASGDVDRRVDVAGGYEVARLGRALNSAFDARESSEQTLRAFISDASHELRTPFTSIRGYTELLQAGALTDDEAQQRALERIEHEAARMGVLVDDLLALARLDEGRPLQLADLDLAAIAADAVNDFRAVEPDRPIELVAPQPVPLVGDETGMRQVFANLLTNARVHTPPATPVEVRVDRVRDAMRASMSIDDGAGLDAADAEHAFDRFWRGANGKRRPRRRQRPRAGDRRRGRGRARWQRVGGPLGRTAPGRALRGDAARAPRDLNAAKFTSCVQVGGRLIPDASAYVVSMKKRIWIVDGPAAQCRSCSLRAAAVGRRPRPPRRRLRPAPPVLPGRREAQRLTTRVPRVPERARRHAARRLRRAGRRRSARSGRHAAGRLAPEPG